MFVIFDRVKRQVYVGDENFVTPSETEGFPAMLFADYSDAFMETRKIIWLYNAGGLSATRPGLDLTIVKAELFPILMEWRNRPVKGERKNVD